MSVTLTFNNPRLAGLPILCTATASARRSATFHRIRLSVTVTPSSGTAATFGFTTPVEYGDDGSVVASKFDISYAVQSVISINKPEATLLSYITYSISIASYEDYMIDGALYTDTGDSLSPTEAVYNGTIPDIYRLYSVWPKKWSLKPTSSPMIAFTERTLLVPGVACGVYPSWTAPSCVPHVVADGLNTTYNYYGIPAPQDGYEIRFVNSLGVHENVFVTCLPTTEVNYTTERHTIAIQETLTQFSRSIAIKKNNHEQWNMSTGPLDQAWQKWYQHEFLKARWAWINIDERYLPIHVIPNDTVKGIDRLKSEPLTVEFAIEFDIEGSPFI